MTDFDISVNPNQISPLSLAYIGDAVYEVYVRSYIMRDVNMPVSKLHKEATRFVSAKAQAEIFRKIESELTEEEFSIFKRGRNAHSYTSAKNADIIDYRISTGFEALIGYIYVKQDTNRLDEIFEMCIHAVNSVGSQH